MSENAPLNSCGCCEGLSVETPVAIYNRPGLPAIAYRVGAYASVRQSLLARLSDAQWPVLRQLRTRDNDDFTVALLDAWAVTSDVLTFYQERIANESYLRTATERLSILEQSHLLGYQLAPGLAAGTYLAFTMETTPGAPGLAPKPVQLAIGTRVLSVPGQDQQPQTFETIEAIEARPEWNAILPQLTEPQTLAWDMTEIWLEGTNLTLAVGDVLLIIGDAGGAKQASLRRVTKVAPDAAANRTALTLVTISKPEDTETAESVAAGPPSVFVMRTIASPFGHNAPQEAIYTDGKLTDFQEWLLDGESDNQLTLSNRQEKIFADSWVVVERENNEEPHQRLWTVTQVTAVTHLSVAKYGIAGIGTQLSFDIDVWITDAEDLTALRKITVAAQNEVLPVAELPLTDPVYGSTLALNMVVDGLRLGRPVAVSGKCQRLRIKSVAVTFSAGQLPDTGEFPDFPGQPDLPDFPDIRLPPILVLDSGGFLFLSVGDILLMAAPPMTVAGSLLGVLTPQEFTAALGETSPPRLRLQVIDRDGKTGRVDISAGAIELVAAAKEDKAVSEIAFIHTDPITAIVYDRDRTTLQLADALTNVYDRATVRINANVAASTHGESAKELLGSGDATLAYQTFTLRQPPLTYISADTPNGRASTLKIYVSDVLWQEAPFFYGRGATERIYILRHDDDGHTTVRFGDGINGARLPTGQNNVRAEYRKGSGLGGLVEAGQISQLLSMPLGLKDVVNPEEAEGAEDPESLDDARRNAPTTVLTLDRAVSLQDYEDFARTFAGVAKAQAVWVWDGRKRRIFLTVAGVDGAVLEEDGAVIANLKMALRGYGDPFVAFTIKSYRQALFQIHGTVTIHADHVIDAVLAAVTEDLSERYSFDSRQFGQPVALSEAIAAIQSIPGVVAADIDQFYRTDATTPAIQPRLIADRPAMGADGFVEAAELLLLDDTSLNQLKAIQ
jgi:hypothetical protein